MSSVSRCFLISALWFGTAALAQAPPTGAIRGTVGDSAGARIGASSVVLVNAATDFRYSTTTDSFGRFAFGLLRPGDYSARAESPGMSPQTTPGLHVDVGGTTTLEFKLAVAGTKETVTVSGEPPLVESQPSGLSSLIDERAINELPVNGRRYTDLASLTPGVTQDPRGLTSGSNGDLAPNPLMLFDTFAHAIDDGQDALLAGQPAGAQNSYAPNAEKGPSVTDQRQRFVLSCVVAPKPFHRDHEWLGLFFNNWKASVWSQWAAGDQ
jgi:hypothetical protein